MKIIVKKSHYSGEHYLDRTFSRNDLLWVWSHQYPFVCYSYFWTVMIKLSSHSRLAEDNGLIFLWWNHSTDHRVVEMLLQDLSYIHLLLSVQVLCGVGWSHKVCSVHQFVIKKVNFELQHQISLFWFRELDLYQCQASSLSWPSALL